MNSIVECERCGLHLTRYHIVPGRGTIPCEIFCIGEAPGKSEDLLGRAFIGESGKLLDQMFFDSKLTGHSMYITNTVLCHPTNRKGGENREPTITEIALCKNNIELLIRSSQARRFLLIGDVAKKHYAKILPGHFYIQHPSFLLRFGGRNCPHYRKNIRILEELNASL